MPIYEYFCEHCNRIFQFLVRDPSGDTGPACPRCGAPDLERRLSRFSTPRVSSGSSSIPDDLADDPVLAGVDENDPRSMARALRRLAEETGEDLGPEFDEAISRLEAGEDPEKIERELEEAGLGDDGQGAPPSYDDGLYEA
ncbi:hypothetical protein JW921_08680 [Candidatus Fermentibacterales bacterium]|nr:hypothetical protein [Candidatus Fermentibacterales bacterium]